MIPLPLIIIPLVLILMNAFFSMAEVALLTVPKARMKRYIKENRHGAKTLQKLRKQPQRMIVTILVGANIVQVSASAYTAVAAEAAFGVRSVSIAAGILTFLLLVFGELTPKTVAQANAGPLALFAAPLIAAIQFILFPVIVVLENITAVVRRIEHKLPKDTLNEMELRAILQYGVDAKAIEPEEQQIMARAMRFSDTVVTQIMTPLQDTFALPSDMPIQQAVRQLLDRGYSRAPVYYGDDIQHVVGLAIMPELTGAVETGGGNALLTDVMDEPLFISSTKGIDDVLKKMTEKRVHLGVVRDRKRRVLGIVTVEDIVEELVGEIEDERNRRKKKR